MSFPWQAGAWQSTACILSQDGEPCPVAARGTTLALIIFCISFLYLSLCVMTNSFNIRFTFHSAPKFSELKHLYETPRKKTCISRGCWTFSCFKQTPTAKKASACASSEGSKGVSTAQPCGFLGGFQALLSLVAGCWPGSCMQFTLKINSFI